MVASLRKVQHEKLEAVWYVDEATEVVGKKVKGGITPEVAKKLLGWEGENDPTVKEVFGNSFKFRDCEGVKVRLANCETNRPFRKSLALIYANDILRNKYELNSEPVIIDCKGNVQSGQHTLVAVILAEQLRKKEPKTWAEYGTRGEISVEKLVTFGIKDDDKVVDTIDIGQKRSLSDVLFRNRQFEEKSEAEQIKLANILQGAVRVVWLCMGGKFVASAPRLLHSVALDVIEAHPKLLDAVIHIFTEDDGSEKQIRKYVSLGYAAGLMYLQATSKTATAKYDEQGSDALDVSLWEKAEEFWTLVGSGAELQKGNPILVLRNFLAGQSASGGHERDEIIAAIKLAWNAFIDGKKVEGVKDLKPGHEVNKKTNKKVLLMPFMGGLDVKREAPPKPAKPTKEEKAAAGAAGGKKGPAKKKGPPKKGGKNTKAVSYPYKEGDEVHCKPAGIDASTKKPYDEYTARVAKIHDDGKVDVAWGKKKDEQVTLNPADGDYIGHEEYVEEVKE